MAIGERKTKLSLKEINKFIDKNGNFQKDCNYNPEDMISDIIFITSKLGYSKFKFRNISYQMLLKIATGNTQGLNMQATAALKNHFNGPPVPPQFKLKSMGVPFHVSQPAI